MLVMRCENRRGEKCSKVAHKTLSHARAADLEQPHVQIVGTVCGCKCECVCVCVWVHGLRVLSGLTDGCSSGVSHYPECNLLEQMYWVKVERRENSIMGCWPMGWEAASLQLYTITHMHASASCRFMLRAYFPVLRWHLPKWAFTNGQQDLATIKIRDKVWDTITVRSLAQYSWTEWGETKIKRTTAQHVGE